MEQIDLQLGDIVETKKPHACGNSEWEVLRLGVDFKLKCCGCGHEIMVERPRALRMIKKICN